MQGGQSRTQNPKPLSGNPVRSPALLGRKRLNPALLLQACDRPIKRSRTKPCPAKARDVFDHRVSVLRTTGEAGQHQHWRVGIVARALTFLSIYYVARTTHDVVIAQRMPSGKENPVHRWRDGHGRVPKRSVGSSRNRLGLESTAS